jgi:serine phosphatase RsbU (regulator of sigma subunit)/Tfp pilus assembly protein PilF
MRAFLFFFGFLSLNTVFAQDPIPSWTSQIDFSDSNTVIKSIADLSIKGDLDNLHSKDLVQLWKLYVYDSLDYREKSNNLTRLLYKSIDKINSPYKTIVFKTLGDIEFDANNFEKAIKYYHLGLDLSKELGNKRSYAAFQKYIGTTYLKLDQFETAERYLRSSLTNSSAIQDKLGIANASISLGNVLKEQGKLDESVVHYQLSLSLANELGNQRLIAGNYNNLGNVERRKGNQTDAIAYFFKALEMNIQSKNQQWESFNYHNIANTYADLKDYKKAIEFFTKSNNLKEKLKDSVSLIDGYKGISDAYAALRDFDKAYENLLKHVQLSEKLRLSDQAIQLKDLEAKYESEKKQLEIEKLKDSREIEHLKNDSLELRNQRNKNMLWFALLVGVFAIIGLVFLWRINLSRKRANLLLNEKNIEIEDTNNSLKNVLQELSIKNLEIMDSIQYATYIQKASLPNFDRINNPNLNFANFYLPKDLVSGDFYFYHAVPEYTFFGIADCTGHGVPGGMVSLIGMNAIDRAISSSYKSDTALLVAEVNQLMTASLEAGSAEINDGMDLSFCRLDNRNKMLQFAGANHSAYLIRKKEHVSDSSIFKERLSDGQLVMYIVDGSRRPIGKSYSHAPFTFVEFEVFPGDRFALFTDGFADQIGGSKGKKLKKENVLRFLFNSADLPIEDQRHFMKEQFFKWKGDLDQVDDVCLMIVEVV